jgi:hypothetical protein
MKPAQCRLSTYVISGAMRDGTRWTVTLQQPAALQQPRTYVVILTLRR